MSVTDEADEMHRKGESKSGGVHAMHLPINLPRSIGNFYTEISNSIICSPIAKHIWGLRKGHL
jgi:hypothetical protein